MTSDRTDLRGARVVVVNWRDPWHSLAGGSERYAWEFARAMVEAGAAVEFWTARDSHQVAREDRDGITIRRRGGTFGFYPSVWLWFLRARLSSRRPAVVVDAENGIPVFSPLVVGRRTRVVLVMHHVHQEQFRTYFPRPVSDLGRWLEAWLMPRVYRRVRTLAVSESTSWEMRRQLDWRPPVQIVPNGADQPDLRDEERSRPDHLVVLGRLATHKRIDVVIRAVARVAQERPGLRLDVVGQGPERERLERLVSELGLGERVRLRGFLPDADKARVLARARLHLCASDAEGWGQVVVEAASYGLPTLARDVPGLRDSVRHEETGWLLPNPVGGDAELVAVLADGIRDALATLDDTGRRAEMAAACRVWGGRFTWPAMRETVRGVVAQELARP